MPVPAAIVINEVEYPSINQASSLLGIRADTIRQRLASTLPKWASWFRKGVKKVLSGIDRMRRGVRVDGVSYDSVTDAARTLGLTVTTVYGRCKSKNDLYLNYEFVSKNIIRTRTRVKGVAVMANGHRYPSIRAAAADLGVSKSCITRKIKSTRHPSFHYVNARTGTLLA